MDRPVTSLACNWYAAYAALRLLRLLRLMRLLRLLRLVKAHGKTNPSRENNLEQLS